MVRWIIFRQNGQMQIAMVTFFEFSHVVEKLDHIATPSVVNRALASAGLTRKAIRNGSGYLPYRIEAEVIEFVARATGDEYLGREIAAGFDYGIYNAYARYVLTAKDLRTALDRGSHSFHLIHPGSEIVLTARGDALLVGRRSGHSAILGQEHLDDGAIVLIIQVMRHFLGANWRPLWIEWSGDKSKRQANMEEIEKVPVIPNADMPAIAVSLTDLDAKNPNPIEPHQAMTMTELPFAMEIRPLETVRDLVQHTLSLQFQLSDLSQDGVLERLSMSGRSLQRALQVEGTSFRDIKKQFIETRARVLLSQTDLETGAIARKLGYDEPKSFERAFKRATGLTPRAYRISGVDQ